MGDETNRVVVKPKEEMSVRRGRKRRQPPPTTNVYAKRTTKKNGSYADMDDKYSYLDLEDDVYKSPKRQQDKKKKPDPKLLEVPKVNHSESSPLAPLDVSIFFNHYIEFAKRNSN